MSTEEKPGRMPIPPGVRARLQKFFEHGNANAAKGAYDYATEMFTQCILGDPGNPLYVKAFLSNLNKKYNNNKKGARLAGLKSVGGKGALKATVARKKWDEVIKAGLEILKDNPWDAGVLADLGKACEALDHTDGEVEFLRQALDSDPDDPEMNRLLGRALDRSGQFNAAIECFTKVLRGKPKDEEAMRAISNLAVKRTIEKGGYEDAQTAQDVRAAKRGFAKDDDEAGNLSPEEFLLRKIEKDPSDKESYIELYDLYIKDEIFDKGVAIMKQALQALGPGDLMIRERYEDGQLRLARQHMNIAEKKFDAEKTPEAEALYRKMKVELNNKETEIYAKRCERYPTNLGFKYELAMRLKMAGKLQEAIKLLQDARSDLKRKGLVLLALGDCFYSIKQYRLALQHYEQAAGEISERDPDFYKGVVYKAGRLAEYLKEWDSAEKHYNVLAAVDFSFKDVAERLDKIIRIRENNGDPDIQ
jgi:tetratricopeptide (TPR) repeat protein